MKVALKFIGASLPLATTISFDELSCNFGVPRKVGSKTGLEQAKSLKTEASTELMFHSVRSV